MDWIGLAILLTTGLLLVLCASVLSCAWMLTHPPRRGYAFAVAKGLPGTPDELPPILGGSRPFREWTHHVETASGRAGLELPVWEIAGDNPAGPTVIVTHGWGESRIHSLLRLHAFLGAASRVILWDMRAHGDATGSCRLGTSEVDDLLSLIGAATEGRDGDGPSAVVLFGASLGAGVSIAAGRDSRVHAVIAEAPYRMPLTPARRVMAQAGMPHRWNLPVAMALVGIAGGNGWDWFFRTGDRSFDRLQHASRLSCPLLVLHGSDDAICPLADGKDIAAATRHGQIQVIEGATHLDLWTDDRFRPRCMDVVGRFVASCAAPTPPPESGPNQNAPTPPHTRCT